MQKVETWHVVFISNEFLEIIKMFPEASTAQEVTLGSETIKGPQSILNASSLHEIQQMLSERLDEIIDANYPNLMIIQKTGSCSICRGPDANIPFTDCPHIQAIPSSIPTFNKRFAVNMEALRAGMTQSTL